MDPVKWANRDETFQRQETYNEVSRIIDWTGAAAGTTGNIRLGLVDLSDTSSFPHGSTTRIDIERVDIDVEALAAGGTSTSVFHIGWLRACAADTCNFVSLFRRRVHNHSGGSYWTDDVRFNQIVSSNSYFLGAGSTNHAGTNLFHSGTEFIAPNSAGTFTLAAGDLVFYGDIQGGTMAVRKIRVHYHSH